MEKKCGVFVKSSVNLMVFVEPFWVNETFSSLTSIMALCGNFLAWSTKRRLTSCCISLDPALVLLKFSILGWIYLAGRPRMCTFFSFSFGFGSSFLIWNRALCDSWRAWVMALQKLPNPKSSGKVLAQCEVMRNLLKTLKITFEKKTSHSNLQGWTQYQNAKTERGHEKSAEDSVESPALKGKNIPIPTSRV